VKYHKTLFLSESSLPVTIIFKEKIAKGGQAQLEQEGSWRIISDTTVYASGFFRFSSEFAPEVPRHIDLISAAPSSTFNRTEIYSLLKSRGLEYDETYKCLLDANFFSSTGALSLCGDQTPLSSENPEFYANAPQLVDAGVQLLAFLGHFLFDKNTLFLPVGIKQVDFLEPLPPTFHAYVVMTDRYESVFTGDIYLGTLDESNTRLNIHLRMAEVTIRSLDSPTLSSTNEATSIYTVSWTPQEIPVENFDDLVSVLSQYKPPDDTLREFYYKGLPGLHKICSLYALRAVSEIISESEQIPPQEFWRPGNTLSIMLGDNVTPAMKRQALRLLQFLEEDELVTPLDAEMKFHVTEKLSEFPQDIVSEIDLLWDHMIDLVIPSLQKDRSMLDIAGKSLKNMILGNSNPLYVLFASPESTGEIEKLYHASCIFRPYHRLLTHVVSTTAKFLARDDRCGKKLRILEVGAGTGTSTSFILPALRELSKLGISVTYTFTDVSKAFLAEGRKKFSDFDFVEYKVFDLGKDPDYQGTIPLPLLLAPPSPLFFLLFSLPLLSFF
jgi:hypothetical protein